MIKKLSLMQQRQKFSIQKAATTNLDNSFPYLSGQNTLF